MKFNFKLISNEICKVAKQNQPTGSKQDVGIVLYLKMHENQFGKKQFRVFEFEKKKKKETLYGILDYQS